MSAITRPTIFVVHHRPDGGRYGYRADPDDAIASARILLSAQEGGWVAGNCHRIIRTNDRLLFKFGGVRLKQDPGIYAAAVVTRPPVQDDEGTWRFRFRLERRITRRLLLEPITGRDLARIVSRSFGASIQPVPVRRSRWVEHRLGADPYERPGVRVTHGLPIRKEPLDKILARTKTWEIRGRATHFRGAIALIESKSGTLVGTCEVVDVVGPLRLSELRRNAKRAGFSPSVLPYSTTYAWVIENARRLREPIPYQHPSGAVVWVRMARSVVRQMEAQSRRR